jgi:amino acid adenylation domain-containing protein
MESPVSSGFWLSPQQKHVWTVQQGSKAPRSVCVVELVGEVSESRLASALAVLVSRHEILRTIYVRQPGMKFPFQAVVDGAKPSMQIIDLSALSEKEQANKLDDLVRAGQHTKVGPEQTPVLSATMATLGAHRHAVVFSLPAMAADCTSMQILASQLVQVTTGAEAPLEAEELRYVQFAQWQNDLIEGDEENSVKGREFWASLPEAPGVALPFEARPSGNFTVEVVEANLDGPTLNRLESLAPQMNSSIGEIFLAAWQCVLWRLTGQVSFRTGVVFDGREYEELRDVVGVIAKTLPIDARFDGDFCFRDVVQHVLSANTKAAEWQEYYVPGAGFGEEPPVTFEYRSRQQICQRAEVNNDSHKLKLTVTRGADGAELQFRYDAARLACNSVERVVGYYIELLRGALSNPDAQVSRLPLLEETESQQLITEWNQTKADYPQSKCFHQLFEDQAAATPDRPALRFDDTVLTYRDLNERANQLAHFLRSRGVGPDSLLGLCLERSAEVIVAVLGILKAGGAYVPLNPDNPKPRLRQQLQGVVALVTSQMLLPQMPDCDGRQICIDRDAGHWAERSRNNPANYTNPENLAYVIYTSGSTGVPKGVAVRHRNLVNYSCFIARRLRLDEFPEGLNFATVSTIGADLGNTCIFPALSSGGVLHVISYEVSTDSQRFAAYSEKHPIDVLKIVPSHLQALLQSPQAKQLLPHKFLILGGETLTPKLAEEIFSLGGTCEVFNHYGPTETTVGSLTLRLADYDWRNSSAGSIPIGRPIANTQIYILDAHLQPLPTGVIGELYIAGDGVTAGYLNQPEKTAERFVQNPFSSDSNARMYRTGDLARWLADGNVEFLGRGDDQVKIRGFRIELGEIESLLTARPGVKQAVVLAREDSRGDKKLVGYVVTEPGQANSADELRAYLKEQLPEVMVPAAIVVIPKIPLNPNGKVDRQALPEPEAAQSRAFLAPNGATEEGVATIWQEVFRRDRIGADENFFDLGGHSLLATQVISRIRERFRVELPIRAMFDHPTISGLAEAVTSASATPAATVAPIVRVSREAYRGGRS